MKRLDNRFPALTLMLLVVAFTVSCSSSRPVKTQNELTEARYSGDPIRILTEDSNYYTFDSFSYDDSTITGVWSRGFGKSEEIFEESLYFEDIVFIERLKTNNWKGLWLVPATISLAGGVVSLMQPSNFEITRPEGSCPFLYAFDGSEYHLEAEAFSTAISKALETETFHVLPNLVPKGGELKVRISNERPETHLFNRIRLHAVDAPTESEVILDIYNRAWALSEARPPLMGQDIHGIDVSRAIREKDGTFWKSDMDMDFARSGFRDTLVVKFRKPDGAEEALIRVDAINSTMINEIFGLAGSLVGDETLGFYQTLERDPELQRYFKGWIDRSSLLVEIKRQTGWVEAGRILPEANEVVFSRGMLLENLRETDGEFLTLRISSMADVWHVDALAVDFAAAPLAMEPVPLLSLEVSGPAGESAMLEAIRDNDSTYAMILPPDYMDLTYDATSTGHMINPTYVMSARGYLYEWLPENGGIPEGLIPNRFRNMDSSDMIAFFTHQEDLLLRTVYKRWQQGSGR